MRKLKPWPVFKTDEEAEKFVEEADLSEYDFSAMRPVQFEFEEKTAPQYAPAGKPACGHQGRGGKAA